MLHSAKQGGASLVFRGAAAPVCRDEDDVSWHVLLPTPLGVEDFKAAEREGAGQGLSVGYLVSKPVDAPRHLQLYVSKYCQNPQAWPGSQEGF